MRVVVVRPIEAAMLVPRVACTLRCPGRDCVSNACAGVITTPLRCLIRGFHSMVAGLRRTRCLEPEPTLCVLPISMMPTDREHRGIIVFLCVPPWPKRGTHASLAL
jgi:hypothetical protein